MHAVHRLRLQALIISSARQGIFLIPTVLILPALLGILGLQLAQPCADVLAFVFTLVLMRGVLAKMRELEEKNRG